MTSRAGVGEEAAGAGVAEAAGSGARTPPVPPGRIETVYSIFRVLVVCEDPSRLDFVSNGIQEFGYTVTTITECGLAVQMLMEPKAFHIIVVDDSVKRFPIKKLLSILKNEVENICISIFTQKYELGIAKLYLNQGAQLVVPYDKIKSFYFMFWQLVLTKNKFHFELKSHREQRKKILWSAEARADFEAKSDFEYAFQFADPDRSPSQAVGNYMRKTRVPRTGALGAGPSVVAQPSYPRTGALGAGPSVVAQPSYLEQLAQAEAGQSVAQPSSFLGAGAIDEGSRDLVLDTGDLMLSDLDFLPDFTQD